MRRSRPLLFLSALLFALTTAVVPAGAITNGQLDGSGHPNVGVIVLNSGSGPHRQCSGELIAPTRFLTAAHCAGFVNNPSVVAGVTFDPTYDPSTSTVIPAVS